MEDLNKKGITLSNYSIFSKKMEALGYRLETDIEKIRTLKKIIIGEPRPQEFSEGTWIIERNGYIGKIQTTVAFTEDGEFLVAESDQAWALISKGDEGLFFMQPFNRLNYFLDNLLHAAEVIKEIIAHLPLCEVCHASMTFENRKDDPRFYELICSRHPKSHPRIHNPYDIAIPYLSKRTAKWLKRRLSRSAYYKRTAHKRGIKYGDAKNRRKPWLLNKENVEKR